MNIFKKLKKLFKQKNYNSGFSMVNQPCFDKYGKFIGWFSRSMATAAVIRMETYSYWLLNVERAQQTSRAIGIVLVATLTSMKQLSNVQFVSWRKKLVLELMKAL